MNRLNRLQDRQRTMKRRWLGTKIGVKRDLITIKTFRSGSRSEKDVVNHLSASKIGWLRGGWPDFLISKGDNVALVEVKHGTDHLNPRQESMHKILKKLGLKVFTIRTDQPGWQKRLEETVA